MSEVEIDKRHVVPLIGMMGTAEITVGRMCDRPLEALSAVTGP